MPPGLDIREQAKGATDLGDDRARRDDREIGLDEHMVDLVRHRRRHGLLRALGVAGDECAARRGERAACEHAQCIALGKGRLDHLVA